MRSLEIEEITDQHSRAQPAAVAIGDVVCDYGL